VGLLTASHRRSRAHRRWHGRSSALRDGPRHGRRPGDRCQRRPATRSACPQSARRDVATLRLAQSVRLLQFATAAAKQLRRRRQNPAHYAARARQGARHGSGRPHQPRAGSVLAPRVLERRRHDRQRSGWGAGGIGEDSCAARTPRSARRDAARAAHGGPTSAAGTRSATRAGVIRSEHSEPKRGHDMRGTRWRRRLLMLVLLMAATGLMAWELGVLPWAEAAHQLNAAASPDAAAPPPRADGTITALGRLRPKDGVTRVAGPVRPAAVIARLLVDKGDRVEAGQVIAVLDSFETLQAHVAGVRAQLDQAQTELRRLDELYRSKVVAVSERDAWRTKVNMYNADLHRAQVELDHASVRAPIAGEILDVHARPGERVGPDGIAEIAHTDQMYAIAEVYETDIGRVHVGQRATITSPVFTEPLQGTVERIGRKVGKIDVVDSDPASMTDARIVSVDVRLDDSQRSGVLTNLQVTVAITP